MIDLVLKVHLPDEYDNILCHKPSTPTIEARLGELLTQLEFKEIMLESVNVGDIMVDRMYEIEATLFLDDTLESISHSVDEASRLIDEIDQHNIIIGDGSVNILQGAEHLGNGLHRIDIPAEDTDNDSIMFVGDGTGNITFAHSSQRMNYPCPSGLWECNECPCYDISKDKCC